MVQHPPTRTVNRQKANWLGVTTGMLRSTAYCYSKRKYPRTHMAAYVTHEHIENESSAILPHHDQTPG